MLRSPGVAEVSLRDRRQALLDRASLTGTAFTTAYAAEADAWFSELAERATGGHRRHVALLAVGGYGRGELCPFSDLDVVLVHDGAKDIAATADAIWYPVWDQGVHLDHSVRRPAEVLEAAAGDLRVALGLLDGRMVWGDDRVAEPLLERTVEVWRSRLGAQWLPTLVDQMAERHRTQGDVAFLLEPELKESHGGLRDVNVLRAVAAYAPLLADYVNLSSLDRAATLLTTVRVELHRNAGRELDRLLLQEQDQIATALNYQDADALMAAVSEAGRGIAWVSDDAWRRRRFWQPDAPRRHRGLFRRSATTSDPAHGPEIGTGDTTEVEPGIVLVGGEAALSAIAAVAEDSSLPLRLAAVAAEHDVPIARGSLHRLTDKMAPPPDPWPAETRQSLVRVLATGARAIDALESLDQHDLLSRLLPEWAAVRHKPQRNAYHRFTVDRHLLEAAANAAALADRVERPDLLVVGALLHDIGKGYPGDHTAVGIELIGRIGTRMGFARGDVETLVAMCRYHLLLPDTATRRDLDDPATIETVAHAAGDIGTLELLGALTEADSVATGASAWGTWKAGLVAELVERTRRYLAGQQAPTRRGLNESHRTLMAEARTSGRPVVLLDSPLVVVAAPDRRGLLSSVAGILALHGLDVRSADVTSEDAVALEIFTVEVGRGSWPDGAKLREDLEAVLSDRLALADRLAAKARAYAGGQRASRARPVVPRVSVDNGASASSTVVEVRAPDEVGLLHRVTRALFDCDLDVVSARVSTVGSEVVDAFYVRDASGARVLDPGALGRLDRSVTAAIT
jgi:[protein-PII] uridylyltransferase